MNLVEEISPKCGQGGGRGGLKLLNFVDALYGCFNSDLRELVQPCTMYIIAHSSDFRSNFSH